MTDGIGLFSELPKHIGAIEQEQTCFVDTSILFSATYDSDKFNTESEFAFDVLAKAKCAIFTNVNVRAEFLESHRRVVIPESLSDLYSKKGPTLDPILFEKLKRHAKSYREKVDNEKNAKMDVHQIRSWKKLLQSYSFDGTDAWTLFCRDFLSGKIYSTWTAAEQIFALNFISSRSGEESPYLNEIPSWEQAGHIMEKYGIASSDAMILNIFLCSKIKYLLTADLELAACAVRESRGTKYIFIPDSAIDA